MQVQLKDTFTLITQLGMYSVSFWVHREILLMLILRIKPRTFYMWDRYANHYAILAAIPVYETHAELVWIIWLNLKDLSKFFLQILCFSCYAEWIFNEANASYLDISSSKQKKFYLKKVFYCHWRKTEAEDFLWIQTSSNLIG